MNIGILGGGNISATHARAAAAIPGVSVVAVWGQHRDKAAAIAAEHHAVAYDDLERFLAHRPMDIVAIGSPSGLHAQHARAAAQQGLHVLVEKPLDISTKQIDALLPEIGRAGVKLGVFFQDRLKPDLVQLKQLITEGTLGKPILASGHVRWYRPPEYYAGSRWRGTFAFDGGGALMNQGVHTVDALLWLMGDVAAVQASTSTLLHQIEVEDTVVATLQFASGALGVLEAATSAFPGYPRRIEITGDEGTAIIEGDRLVAVDLRTPGRVLIASAPETSTVSQASPVVSDVTPHRRILEDFIDAIRTNRTPVCSGAEARRSVAVVEAIYESARTGNRVSLND